jgi:hypothetical protein
MDTLTWLVKAAGLGMGNANMEALHRDTGLDYCTDGFRVHVARTNAEPIGVLGAIPTTPPAVAVWVLAGELHEAACRAMAAVGSTKPHRCDLHLALPGMIICAAALYVADGASGCAKEEPCQIMAWAPEKPFLINNQEHCALIMPKRMITSDDRITAMAADGTVLAVAYVNDYPFVAGKLAISIRHPDGGFVPGWPCDERGVCHAPDDAPVVATLTNMATGETVSLP